VKADPFFNFDRPALIFDPPRRVTRGSIEDFVDL
jgi:hypothetical protein